MWLCLLVGRKEGVCIGGGEYVCGGGKGCGEEERGVCGRGRLLICLVGVHTCAGPHAFRLCTCVFVI